jgi:hypothetical protein
MLPEWRVNCYLLKQGDVVPDIGARSDTVAATQASHDVADQVTIQVRSDLSTWKV